MSPAGALTSTGWVRRASAGSGRARELAELTDASAPPFRPRGGGAVRRGGGLGKTSLVERARPARPAARAPSLLPATRSTSPTRRRSGRCCPRSATAGARGPTTPRRCGKWSRASRTRTARPGAGPPVVLLDLLHQLIIDLAELRPVLAGGRRPPVGRPVDPRSGRLPRRQPVHEPVLVVSTFRNDRPVPTPDLGVALAELRRHRKVTALERAPAATRVVAELVADWAPGATRSRAARLAALGGQRVHRRGDGSRRARRRRPRPADHLARSRAEPDRAALAERAAGGAGDRVRRRAAAPPAAGRRRSTSPVTTLLEAIREAVAHGVARVDENGDGYQLRHGLMTEVVRPTSCRASASSCTAARARPGRATSEPTQPGAGGPDRASLVRGGRRRRRRWWPPSRPPGRREGVHAHSEAHRLWLRAAELVDRARVRRGRHRPPRSASTARRGPPSSRATTTKRSRCSSSSSAPTTPPRGLPAALLTPARAARSRPLGLATEAEALPGRCRAAARHRCGGRACAGARRVQRAPCCTPWTSPGRGPSPLRPLPSPAAPGRARSRRRILAVLGLQPRLPGGRGGGLGRDRGGARRRRADGEPEAVGEAHLRRAELLAGPLNQLVEGIECARVGVERMRSLGLARTAGVALLTYAANAIFRLGRWDDARPLGRGGLEPRPDRRRRARRAAGAVPHRPRPGDGWTRQRTISRPWSCSRARPPARDTGSRSWCCSPRSSCGGGSRGSAPLRRGRPGGRRGGGRRHLVGRPAGLARHPRLGGHHHGGPPQPSPAQVDRLRHHCAELARRGPSTVPAVRAVIEAFSLMCAAEIGPRRAPRRSRRHGSAPPTPGNATISPYPAAYARLRHAEALLPRGHAAPPRPTCSAGPTASPATSARRPLLEDIADLAAPGPHPAHRARSPTRRTRRRRGRRSTRSPRASLRCSVSSPRPDQPGDRQRLYISEKTVGAHVARIFAKIDVHSRVQASAFLHRSRPVLR